jgi:hypothetical protein
MKISRLSSLLCMVSMILTCFCIYHTASPFSIYRDKGAKKPAAGAKAPAPSKIMKAAQKKALKQAQEEEDIETLAPYFMMIEKAKDLGQQGRWECPTCTAENGLLTEKCTECNTPRPAIYDMYLGEKHEKDSKGPVANLPGLSDADKKLVQKIEKKEASIGQDLPQNAAEQQKRIHQLAEIAVEIKQLQDADVQQALMNDILVTYNQALKKFYDDRLAAAGSAEKAGVALALLPGAEAQEEEHEQGAPPAPAPMPMGEEKTPQKKAAEAERELRRKAAEQTADENAEQAKIERAERELRREAAVKAAEARLAAQGRQRSQSAVASQPPVAPAGQPAGSTETLTVRAKAHLGEKAEEPEIAAFTPTSPASRKTLPLTTKDLAARKLQLRKPTPQEIQAAQQAKRDKRGEPLSGAAETVFAKEQEEQAKQDEQRAKAEQTQRIQKAQDGINAVTTNTGYFKFGMGKFIKEGTSDWSQGVGILTAQPFLTTRAQLIKEAQDAVALITDPTKKPSF